MSDRITFLVFAPGNSIFTEEAAASMVGKETLLDGSPVKIAAAVLTDNGAIRLTVEGVPAETMEAVRRGTLKGVSVDETGRS